MVIGVRGGCTWITALLWIMPIGGAAESRVREGTVAKSENGIGACSTLLIQLRVADLDQSIAFYRDVLGFRLKERNESLRWAKLNAGINGVTIGIGEGPNVVGSGSTSMNFGVIDIDTVRAELEKKGITFLGETITVPGTVRLADFEDLDGNRIRLAQSLATVKIAPEDKKTNRPSANSTLSQLSWLTGTWRTTLGDDILEEIWSAPTHDSMMGVFRWIKKDRVWMNELMTITADGGGFAFRLRHFSRDMVPWEEKDAAFHYPCVSQSGSSVVFENPERDQPRRFVYNREGNVLRVRLEGPDPAIAEHQREFVYERVRD